VEREEQDPKIFLFLTGFTGSTGLKTETSNHALALDLPSGKSCSSCPKTAFALL
jgi:hypothetical protein